MLWGLCVAVTAACKNFGSLVTVRVLLGCFESAVAPAYVVMWQLLFPIKHQLI